MAVRWIEVYLRFSQGSLFDGIAIDFCVRRNLAEVEKRVELTEWAAQLDLTRELTVRIWILRVEPAVPAHWLGAAKITERSRRYNLGEARVFQIRAVKEEQHGGH